MRVQAQHSRIIFLLVAAILALPFSTGLLVGIFLWTSPLLFLIALFSGQRLSLLSLVGAVTLLLVTIRKRWYCRWMCPTGFLCDAVSKISRFKLMTWMPRLGAVLAFLILTAALFKVPSLGLLDPIAIFHVFFSGFHKFSLALLLPSTIGLLVVVDINFLSRNIWCSKLSFNRSQRMRSLFAFLSL